jgi:3-oxoacyl-(acyl-carrier-protein) synthase
MRPYDVSRNGYVLGEGATILVLEAEESALRRRARIYGEIAGWGQATEVGDVRDYPPSARPMVRAMDGALGMAGSRASEIDWICGSANASRRLDLLEVEAARKLSRGGARAVALSSVKPVFGESMAGGAVRLASSLLAMREGFIPPTPSLRDPEDPEGVDHVTGKCRDPVRLDLVLLNGAADGGGCIALVLRGQGRFDS